MWPPLSPKYIPDYAPLHWYTRTIWYSCQRINMICSYLFDIRQIDFVNDPTNHLRLQNFIQYHQTFRQSKTNDNIISEKRGGGKSNHSALGCVQIYLILYDRFSLFTILSTLWQITFHLNIINLYMTKI